MSVCDSGGGAEGGYGDRGGRQEEGMPTEQWNYTRRWAGYPQTQLPPHKRYIHTGNSYILYVVRTYYMLSYMLFRLFLPAMH